MEETGTLAGLEGVESVTQFTRRIKTLLERGITACWVRGEVSNLKIQSSGHVYFSLKDAGAQVSAVLFRGDALRQSLKLRDGMQVLARGQLSVYEPRGQYQLVVRTLVEDGVGRLQREFEALKARLSEEGLFDSSRKRPLPALPRCVAFLTSPTGAAVRDFMRILERRGWRGRAVLIPCKVQGEGAAAEIAAQLLYAQSLERGPEDQLLPPGSGGPPFFDLLVVGRGGGSLEDLWAFNEEVLVRAVAASSLPVISAVGHEIDFTLCDFAADLRAETPSGAAELISSSYVACLERSSRLGADLHRLTERSLLASRRNLEPLRGRLRLLAPAAQIERGFLRLDDLCNRLQSALRHVVVKKSRTLEQLSSSLASHSPERRIQLESHRLLALYKRLQSVSPQSVLNRGFVIMRDEQGRPVLRGAGLCDGTTLQAQFADAERRVVIRD